MIKRCAFLLVCVVILGVGNLAAQEIELDGTWTAFAPTQLPAYSLREHTNPAAAEDPAKGQVTFGNDGDFASTFLPYNEWEITDGFVVLSEGEQQGFFAVRELTADVLVLTSLTVTEQNRRIISIRVHRPDSLLLIRD